MTTGKTNTIKNRTSHIWRVSGPRDILISHAYGESVKEPGSDRQLNIPQTVASLDTVKNTIKPHG